MTLQAALDGYLDRRPKLRPESIRAYRQIERYLSSWLDSPVRMITPEMVTKKHRQLGTDIGTTSANAAMRTLRIVLKMLLKGFRTRRRTR